ncbi:hypothetical protein Nepgr_002307 [Nepenthes gracilis]|uniref:Reticulon-like protein n=1 Tax=Nepenthes gracilis TaxID=150966 RepID=A0AAD3RY69_NEPGR|nr:hypothetical protein Nepgr_002307 [Nepenthes gracilis]
MVENNETTGSLGSESLMEKIAEKLHGNDSSSSSSDSETEKTTSAASTVTAKTYRLFGREKPIHQVLGGGKPADLVLWRNKKVSGSVLGTATIIWVLFELLEYHLLTLICHILIFSLAIIFLWSNASSFINKSPPPIPKVQLPEEPLLEFASALRFEINRGFAALREIASGRDLKKFLTVIAGLWVLSFVGSSWNFLTLFYLSFVLLHIVPVLYEKYENKVDSFAEVATREVKKRYSFVNDNYLSKITAGRLKAKVA